MKNLVIFCLVIILAGCTTISNISESSLFEDELGTKHLVKDSFICAVDNIAIFQEKLPANVLYENHGFKSCPRGTDVAPILKGSEIKITEVSHRSNFGFVSYTDHWYFIGSVDIEGKTVRFYYYLGLTTDGQPPANYKDNLLWY